MVIFVSRVFFLSFFLSLQILERTCNATKEAIETFSYISTNRTQRTQQKMVCIHYNIKIKKLSFLSQKILGLTNDVFALITEKKLIKIIFSAFFTIFILKFSNKYIYLNVLHIHLRLSQRFLSGCENSYMLERIVLYHNSVIYMKINTKLKHM